MQVAKSGDAGKSEVANRNQIRTGSRRFGQGSFAIQMHTWPVLPSVQSASQFVLQTICTVVFMIVHKLKLFINYCLSGPASAALTTNAETRRTSLDV